MRRPRVRGHGGQPAGRFLAPVTLAEQQIENPAQQDQRRDGAGSESRLTGEQAADLEHNQVSRNLTDHGHIAVYRKTQLRQMPAHLILTGNPANRDGLSCLCHCQRHHSALLLS